MCFGSGLKGQNMDNLDNSQPVRQVSIADYSHEQHGYSAPAPNRRQTIPLSSNDAYTELTPYKTVSTDANGQPVYQTRTTDAAGRPVYRTQSTDLPKEMVSMGNDMAGGGADEVHGKGWKVKKGVLRGFEPSRRTEGSGVIA